MISLEDRVAALEAEVERLRQAEPDAVLMARLERVLPVLMARQAKRAPVPGQHRTS